MIELKNYVELEHIATGYPVTIALNSKECQLLSHYYNVRADEVISYKDFKSYESEAYAVSYTHLTLPTNREV